MRKGPTTPVGMHVIPIKFSILPASSSAPGCGAFPDRWGRGPANSSRNSIRFRTASSLVSPRPGTGGGIGRSSREVGASASLRSATFAPLLRRRAISAARLYGIGMCLLIYSFSSVGFTKAIGLPVSDAEYGMRLLSSSYRRVHVSTPGIFCGSNRNRLTLSS